MSDFKLNQQSLPVVKKISKLAYNICFCTIDNAAEKVSLEQLSQALKSGSIANECSSKFMGKLDQETSAKKKITSHLRNLQMYMEVFYADNSKYPSAADLNNMPEAKKDIDELLAISEVQLRASEVSYTITATSLQHPEIIVSVNSKPLD